MGTHLPSNMKNVLQDDLIRGTLKWSGKFTLKVKKSEGYIKIFPSKKQKHFFMIAIYQAQNFTSVFPLHENVGKKDQILKMLVVAILCPFKS